MKLPERQSLVTQAVQIIQKMILNGTLSSPLPGERILASKLQIGRDTLRNALIELERTKWISPSAQGQRRQTLKTPQKLTKPTTTKRIGIISPKSLEALPSPMLIEFDALRDILASRNILLSILTPPVFESKNPAARLKQFIQDHPADAWILTNAQPPSSNGSLTKTSPASSAATPTRASISPTSTKIGKPPHSTLETN